MYKIVYYIEHVFNHTMFNYNVVDGIVKTGLYTINNFVKHVLTVLLQSEW